MRFVLLFIAYIYANVNPAPAPAALDPAEIFCVSTAIYHEARGEPAAGQIAVAYAIKHRVGSKDFPSTACGVVYQQTPVEQFTDIRKARPDYESKAWKDAVETATLVWAGMVADPVNGARFYYNPKKAAKPTWARITVLAVIGNHNFYEVENG